MSVEFDIDEPPPKTDERLVWDAFEELDGVGRAISVGDVRCMVKLIQTVRTAERDRCARIVKEHVSNLSVRGRTLDAISKGSAP